MPCNEWRGYSYHQPSLLFFVGCFDRYPPRCNGLSACSRWAEREYGQKTCGTCYSNHFVEFYIINIIKFEKANNNYIDVFVLTHLCLQERE